MLLNCIAIDPDPRSLQVLEACIKKVPTLRLLQAFDNVMSAMQFAGEETAQLLFVNISSENIKELLLRVSGDSTPMIILISENKVPAVEGLELETVDYLIKPLGLERFRKAVAKAEEYYKYRTSLQSEEECLYVYAEYKLIKVNLDEIEFIESMDDFTRIHLTDGKPVLTLMPLKKVLQKLPPAKFQQIHRSYVVAVKKIQSFTSKKVVLENAEVPVSDSYIEELRKLKMR